MNFKEIDQAITVATGKPFITMQHRSVVGGSINSAFLLASDREKYFLKTNSTNYTDMFAAEAEGLKELRSSNTIKCPEPICWGNNSDISYLVMEFIPMASGKRNSAELLGRQLATLHRTSSSLFGWHRNNTIGSTTQLNDQSSNWVEFYSSQRLGYQLSLIKQQGFGSQLIEQGEILCEKLPSFFSSYAPVPALIHGDLWSGNYAYSEAGDPVIFDPACYFADREADIAMTELFGGFSSDFYASYNEAYPLDSGYNERKVLYNLYHILNHLNLFGSSYYSQALNMTEQLLAEAR